MKFQINKARLFRHFLLIFLLGGVITVFFANRYLKTKGFDNLIDFISNYRENKNLANSVDPQELKLLISDEDYEFLKNKRQEALDRGIQINEGDNFVDCKVIQGKDTIKGEIRLKGHMTDHLQGEKWSFRIKTEKEVLGMYRFSLQHPGTRNYVYEWIYHELLKSEGIIALKYDFIRLQLNDKDLGIYAIEEHFGQHILRDNNRPPGAILRWNPELYWEKRIDELDGVYIDEPYSEFSSSFTEPYDGGVIENDPKLVETYLKGAAQLEAFRRGEKTTSQVFDLEKMARFHAVIDLVGGYHSLDWSDVKFFYNSKTDLVEPVGYESFSVRETIKIAGQRTPEDYEQIGFNFHDRLFADPVFYATYIQELERICDEAYFDKFIASIEKELSLKRGILAHEFAYIKFSLDPYFKNISLIRKNTQLPKAFHAFLEVSTDSTLKISLTPVSDFPIQITSLLIDGNEEIPIQPVFNLPPKARNSYAHYWFLELPYTSKKLKNLVLKAHIPGSKHVFEISVLDLPSYRTLAPMDSLNIPAKQADSSLVWINDSVGVFRPQKITISERILIPKNTTLQLRKNQTLVFTKDGQLVIEGTLAFYGGVDQEILINSAPFAQARLVINGGKLLASNCSFVALPANFIQAKHADLSFQTCQFAQTQGDFIQATTSKITFSKCASGQMNSLGSFDRCFVRLIEFSAKNGGIFISSFGSDVEMKASAVANYQQLALLNYSSDFSTWYSNFDEIDLLSELNNHSVFNCYSGEITQSKQGFKVDLATTLGGKSTYLLYRTNYEFSGKKEEVKS
jgi:hypothetical protein